MPNDEAALKRDKRYRAIAAAVLSEQGKSQMEIVEELRRISIDTSQPEVSRLLIYAANKNLYSPNPRVLLGHDGVSQEEFNNVQQWFFRDKALEGLLHGWSPKLKPIPYVIKAPTFREELKPKDKLRRLEEHFYPAAAAYLRDLLLNSRTIGLLWGRTISILIDSLRSIVQPTDLNLKVIPLCGEPLFLSNLRQAPYSASTLAEKLSRILMKNPPEDTPSLMGVPCYVRTDLFKKNFKEFLRSIPGYREIFGEWQPGRRKQEAMVNEVDTLITSVGVFLPNDEHKISFLYERIKQEKTRDSNRLITSEKDLEKLVLGDIGGYLIGKPNLSPAQQVTVRKLNDEGWTGLTSADLKKISERAFANKGSGVVIIAFQPEKWPILKHIIQNCHYVNRVIVSEALAEKLKEA